MNEFFLGHCSSENSHSAENGCYESPVDHKTSIWQEFQTYLLKTNKSIFIKLHAEFYFSHVCHVVADLQLGCPEVGNWMEELYEGKTRENLKMSGDDKEKLKGEGETWANLLCRSVLGNTLLKVSPARCV